MFMRLTIELIYMLIQRKCYSISINRCYNIILLKYQKYLLIFPHVTILPFGFLTKIWPCLGPQITVVTIEEGCHIIAVNIFAFK